MRWEHSAIDVITCTVHCTHCTQQLLSKHSFFCSPISTIKARHRRSLAQLATSGVPNVRVAGEWRNLACNTWFRFISPLTICHDPKHPTPNTKVVAKWIVLKCLSPITNSPYFFVILECCNAFHTMTISNSALLPVTCKVLWSAPRLQCNKYRTMSCNLHFWRPVSWNKLPARIVSLLLQRRHRNKHALTRHPVYKAMN